MTKREKMVSAIRSVEASREITADPKVRPAPQRYTPSGAPPHDNESALEHAKAICALLFGDAGTRAFPIRYWDGSLEPATGNPLPFTFVIERAGALRRMLLPPNELSIIEAALSGDVEIEGDMEQAMWMGDGINERLRSPATLFALVRHMLALPREEAGANVRELRAEHTVGRAGDVHAPERDRAAIRYHYDVGNDF